MKGNTTAYLYWRMRLSQNLEVTTDDGHPQCQTLSFSASDCWTEPTIGMKGFLGISPQYLCWLSRLGDCLKGPQSGLKSGKNLSREFF